VTIIRLGGMMAPRRPEEAVTAAPNTGSYPFLFIPGIMMLPIAAVVAVAEPEIAPKNMEAAMVTIASPPLSHPTRELTKLTSLREMPPVSIRFPPKIKKGRAINGKESAAATILWTATVKGTSTPEMIVAQAASPKAKPIGQPMANRMNSVINKTIADIIKPPSDDFCPNNRS
jgi:hypothetical protein